MSLKLGALGFLCLALSACTDSLADRCDFDNQCDEHQICSNAGDRHRSGICIAEPDAAPVEPDAAPDSAPVEPDAAADASTDATTDGGAQ